MTDARHDQQLVAHAWMCYEHDILPVTWYILLYSTWYDTSTWYCTVPGAHSYTTSVPGMIAYT